MAKSSLSSGVAKPPSNDSRAWDALTPALSEWILEAVDSMGFARMTPVQASTIPLFMGNKDPVVEAVTGSGKTLSFLIPVVERLLNLEDAIPKHHIGALIISPTRELATQIHGVLLQLLAFHAPSAANLEQRQLHDFDGRLDGQAQGLDTTRQQSSLAPKIVPLLLLGGGQTPQADIAQFLQKSPNAIIATPGRLIELLSSPYVHTPQSSFQVLVMDEADRLLDMGFQDTLQKILQRLPKQRRTGLFSASINDAVERLVRVGIQNPYRINVKVRGAQGEEDMRTPASLSTHYLTTQANHKLPALLHLLIDLSPKPHRTIAYLPTCALVDYLHAILSSVLPASLNTTRIIPLHGHLTQPHRALNLHNFTDSPTPALLLTTDLASRGLDIPAVDLTVQLDPPTSPSSYLHRAGRAARAGRPGLSVLFLLPGRETDEYPAFLSIRKTPVTPLPASLLSTNEVLTITSDMAASTTAVLRAKVLTDRALHEKSQRAIPGYVQAYRKHVASSIFRVQELPWRELAEGWGLLKLPKMPEVRKSGFQGGLDLGVVVAWDGYAYKDKKREEMRRAKLNAAVPDSQEDSKAGNAAATLGKSSRAKKRKEKAWTRNAAITDEKDERRERKKRKKAAESSSKLDGAQLLERKELNQLIETVRAKNALEMSGASGKAV